MTITTVHGHKVRYSGNSRYFLTISSEGGAHTVKRSGSLETLETVRRRAGYRAGVIFQAWDTAARIDGTRQDLFDPDVWGVGREVEARARRERVGIAAPSADETADWPRARVTPEGQIVRLS